MARKPTYDDLVREEKRAAIDNMKAQTSLLRAQARKARAEAKAAEEIDSR